MAKTFTREEVEAHKKPDDLWIVIHNKVYDVSAYREEHPGGAQLLIDVGGIDATEAFEDVGHSDDARDLLDPLLIGELSKEEAHEVVETYRPNFEVVSTVNELRMTSGGSSVLGTAAIAVLVMIGGGAALYFGKSLKSIPTLSLHQLRGQLGGLPVSRATFASGGFWKGFATAAMVSSVTAAGGFLHLGKMMEIQKDFQKYAPHKAVSLQIHVRKAASAEPVLHPQKYRKFPLIRKDVLSPNVYRFVFKLPKPRDVLGLPTGQHVAIRTEINGKMVSRSYTPVSNDSDLGRIELVVKVYPGGLITNYLANLELNDLVEFRGPKGAMKYHSGLCKSLGMIAGGTGITPMYQLIRTICEDPKDNTKISLIYGNQTEGDILLREELDGFQSKFPEKFGVWYVLNTAPPGWKYGQGFVSKDTIKEKLAAPSSDSKVHLCGPPGMINAMKKNLTELGFQAPGPISKADDQIFMF
ncbi:NADH-cytochrome b5 reductase [Lachnellula subtilissima]|uniref:NADH-cytochrome b5 reductase 1 n=1 Tax=Lachnellula subtilissima TaxID=602034 RepID=A0A8H8U6Z0_9HELO|nr:NADH-cytochrome b5 reductase [Lachnellula subtilissima]